MTVRTIPTSTVTLSVLLLLPGLCPAGTAGQGRGAGGRGSPWLGLDEASEVAVSYLGEDGPARALRAGEAVPLALASVDLDRDGAPDLVAGWAGPEGGILAIHRGSLLSRFAESPAARAWAARAGAVAGERFLRRVEVFPVPSAPDFLATGDFDGDGRPDVIAAARGEAALWLLRGDGGARVGPAERVTLPGGVTALAAGDVNRPDGVPALLAGIAAPSGDALLLWDAPGSGGPREIVPMPGEVTAIATGRIDGDLSRDVAAAAGGRLAVVRGEDARTGEADSAAAVVDLPFEVLDVALGHFLGEERGVRADLALVSGSGEIHLIETGDDPGTRGALVVTREALVEPVTSSSPGRVGLLRAAKISSRPHDDLVLVDPAAGEIHVVAGAAEVVTLRAASAPAALLPMRLNEDALADLAMLREGAAGPSVIPSAPQAAFLVDSFGDAPDSAPGDGACSDTVTGACTLRAAIMEANASPGPDAIRFALGAGTPTISPGSALPDLDEAVTILGDSGGATRIEIEGSGAGAAIGLLLDASVGSTLHALVINRFQLDGIRINASANVVENCLVGTDAAGGGSVPGNGGAGINLNPTVLHGPNLIGGALPARNVVSNNGGAGIRAGGADDVIEGNYIGTDAAGAVALPNAGGVGIDTVATGVRVGGSAAAPGLPPGNLISGNTGEGVRLTNVDGNRVQGNLIGVDAGGTAALPNGIGILFTNDADGNQIGGGSPDLTNVISGNVSTGVFIAGNALQDPSGNAIEGNLVGTDVTGTIALPNGGGGVAVRFASGNRIGGSTGFPGTPPGNVISGNAVSGVAIEIASSNTVAGNLIGTTRDGDGGLPNVGPGVSIRDTDGTNAGDARLNVVGGDRRGEGNVISANLGAGVRISGPLARENSVYGNVIGINASLAGDLGNEGHGVFITGDAFRNDVGAPGTSALGDCAGLCNLVAYNAGSGVRIDAAGSVQNPIRQNSIFDNVGLGIDLGGAGVTPNDAQDPDAGANGLQNFPAIEDAVFDGVNTTVTMRLRSAPLGRYEIDVFGNFYPDPSGHGEGRFWLGSAACAADAAGDCPVVTVVTPGEPIWISATATAVPDQATSEFSGSYVNPDEALDLMVSPGFGTAVDITFTPACGASDHAVYWGTTPIAGSLVWTNSACGLGTFGVATFDPGTPALGEAFYFAVVGQNGTREGSYGQDSALAERPEAPGFVGFCDLPQSLTNTCP
jgi:CSLREA domain-containing protein